MNFKAYYLNYTLFKIKDKVYQTVIKLKNSQSI